MIDAAPVIRRIAASIARCAFPDVCVLCGGQDATGYANGYFCARCFGDLPRMPAACSRCGVPVAKALPDDLECADCQLRPPPFQAARAALLYTFPVDAALKALKFRRQLYYAPAFAELLHTELTRYFPDVDALAPVPLHRWRHATRGFNQAIELCTPLCRQTGLPLVRNARRIRQTEPQTGLNARERRRNLRNAFAVKGELHCRHPLIVDDVMTTGETCRQLASALRDAGATTVHVLTVARAAPVR